MAANERPAQDLDVRPVEFYSDGIRLAGLLHTAGTAPRRRPAVVLCSGFQGLKELIPAKLWAPLTAAGLATFSFDYRGFGTSDGERGRVIPGEQVRDVRHAIDVLQQQPEVDPDRIALVGWGLGGGIVVQAAADDQRVCAVACLNGIGDGRRAVRALASDVHWRSMQERIAADRLRRARGERSERVSPWDVVPLDLVTRTAVDLDMYANHARFATDPVSLESAEAYYAFRPEDDVSRISPRPLLLVHGVRNSLHSVAEARSLYARASEPKTLHEIPEAHHLDWIQPGSPLYWTHVPFVTGWITEHLGA